MCTAIYAFGHFGRTLDLEYGYNESVTVCPRCFAFNFRYAKPLETHHAMIGMAAVADGYPLYYDAANEKGLAMAGLNFPHSAVYFPLAARKNNLAPFELIPYILGKCASVREAVDELAQINVCDISFSEEYKTTPLHWMISDAERSIVIESVQDGLHIYENPVNVMTNEPPFPHHMLRLVDFANLTSGTSEWRFSQQYDIAHYSRGMGAMGLPGDMSSVSRFVRAAFVSANSVTVGDVVSQFFNLLGSVNVPRGTVAIGGGKYVTTRYTSCIDLAKGVYYYRTYGNHRICGVDMLRENLDGAALISYPLNEKEDILMQN